MIVAGLSGTGMVKAFAWSLLFALVGPTIAYFAFDNPRRPVVRLRLYRDVPGGFLVYFGQGPMQIEMHFYFFVLIALLAVFANPLVIVVAAVTVAAHYIYCPSISSIPRPGIFNYHASAWTVPGPRALRPSSSRSPRASWRAASSTT